MGTEVQKKKKEEEQEGVLPEAATPGGGGESRGLAAGTLTSDEMPFSQTQRLGVELGAVGHGTEQTSEWELDAGGCCNKHLKLLLLKIT